MIKFSFFLALLVFGLSIQAQISDFNTVDFSKADSVATLYQNENLSNLPALSYHLTSPFSNEAEQFRAIYTWVCQNVKNDYEYYLKNTKKRAKFQQDSIALSNWNNSFKVKVFDRLVKEQRTICTGYAYLVRELATLADINCKIIDGYCRTTNSNIGGNGIPNHSWNAVQLNNKWYLCDATWSSGSTLSTNNQYLFIKDYDTGYFLADPALFIKNHYPLDTTWALMNNIPKLDEFLFAPIIYKHAFNHLVIPLSPSTLKTEITKGETLTFLFETLKKVEIDKISLELSSDSRNFIIQPNITFISNEILEFEHNFNQTGYYDVHLRINEHEIATYSVWVKKNKG